MPASLQQRVRRVRPGGQVRIDFGLFAEQAQGALHELLLVPVVDDEIDAETGAHGIGIEARVATGYDQPRRRVAAPQAIDLLARLAVRLRRHRAGIEHHEIRLAGIGGQLVAQLHELTGPGFQFRFVEPASQRLEIDIHVRSAIEKIWRILSGKRGTRRFYWRSSSCRRFSRAFNSVVESTPSSFSTWS
jgi:hypothetical protein